MARNFVRASSEFLEVDTAVLTAYPFTFACWGYSDDNTNNQTVMGIADLSVTNHWWVLRMDGFAGDLINFSARAGGATEAATTSTTYSLNTWHHLCGVAVSATDRSVFLDGGSEGTNTTNITPSGLDRTSIGHSGDSSPSNHMSGRIAEAAIWNIDLTDAEVAALAAGVSPLLVRPNHLVFYDPLIRGRGSDGGGDSRDIVGGLIMMDNNTVTVADHTPIIYPILTIPPGVLVPGFGLLQITATINDDDSVSADIDLNATVETISTPIADDDSVSADVSLTATVATIATPITDDDTISADTVLTATVETIATPIADDDSVSANATLVGITTRSSGFIG